MKIDVCFVDDLQTFYPSEANGISRQSYIAKQFLEKKLSLWYVGLQMLINVIRLTVHTPVLFHPQAERLFRSLDFGVVTKEYA